MKHTLLLRLKAPMQSWGTSSRFSIRETGKEPSKSGVIGLLCAALGISRDAANAEKNPQFDELGKLKMSVRVLREGVMQKDYHTAQNIAKADGGIKPTELSDRWYLADADFLVGLESGDLPLLESLQTALKNPKWQLFFGRKAFVPSVPVYFREGVFTNKEIDDFLKSDELEEILKTYQKELNLKVQERSESQRLIIEDENGREVRRDVPLDFAARQFSIRRVRTEFISPKGVEENGNLFDEDDSESDLLESAA
jgi:CRISPR system Cascade subunit CasD